MAKHIRIVLADDHFVVRAGTRAILESNPDLSVVGEASNGLDAIELVDTLQPDLLVTDIEMPHLTGDEVVKRVHDAYPYLPIIVMSMYKDERHIARVLQNGASAYMLKGASEYELNKAVRSVINGEQFLGTPFDEKGVGYYTAIDLTAEQNTIGQLTKREREILQQVVEGKTSAEIALRLSIAQRTVETHRANIMRKLQLNSVPDLIRFAIQHDLVTL